MYLWTCAPNLQKIKAAHELVHGEQYPHGGDQAEVTEADILKLFKANRMPELENFDVFMRLRNIEAARMFIEKMPAKVEKISNLVIRVALPQDNYVSQEQMLVDIAHVMNRMKQFKDYCAQIKAKTGREIKWTWYRVGILESIGNLGLNNFDPDDPDAE